MPHILSIDIETYSSNDLLSGGVYKYVEGPNFEILLFGWSLNYGPAQVISFADGHKLPKMLLEALTSPDVLKTAFNAQFERICLQKYLGITLPVEQWDCTMVRSAVAGLPLSLKSVSEALDTTSKKDPSGLGLIKYFSVPCKPTARNGMRTRNLPLHDFVKWQEFKDYCKKDVETENAIRKQLEGIVITDTEKLLYVLDQKINDTGIRIDRQLAANAIGISDSYTDEIKAEAAELTGLSNPNSDAQLKAWIYDTTGNRVASLNKSAMADVKEGISDEDVLHALKLRGQMSKSSIKKYQTMVDCITADDRAHGLLQYYGANRTGRWSGRLIQIQNLPRINVGDIGLARGLVRQGKEDLLRMLYGNVPGILSELIRTAFIASEGCRLIVADFSAIEARVIAWLAGEQWRLELFKGDGKIYEASASAMFGVPKELITKDHPLRQKGKIAELACIAEGQLVLTDSGLIPIEKIKRSHKVWDGEAFIHHGGLIFKGYKNVISYDGLTATEDHLVWIEGESRPVQFGGAAAICAHLTKSGNGWRPVRVGENNKRRKEVEEKLEGANGINTMCKLQKHPMDGFLQLNKSQVERVSAMLTTETGSDMAGSATDGGKTTLRKSFRSRIQKLRSAGDSVQIQFSDGGRTLVNYQSGLTKPRIGNRPHKQQWALRKGEYSICHTSGKQLKQEVNCTSGLGSQQMAVCKNSGIAISERRAKQRTDIPKSDFSRISKTEKLAKHSKKVRVYDLLNCGPNNRFTVSDVLVHNCGYGGGVGALTAMGALNMGLSEDDLPDIIRRWRSANRNIVSYWDRVEADAKMALEYHGTEVRTRGNCSFLKEADALTIKLSSGRVLYYREATLRMQSMRNPVIMYKGLNQVTKKWEDVTTWGGKIVENIVQAVSRDLLAEALLRLDKAGYRIVAHVHDEVILDMPIDTGSLEEVIGIMTENPEWAEGLPLAADGFESFFYKK